MGEGGRASRAMRQHAPKAIPFSVALSRGGLWHGARSDAIHRCQATKKPRPFERGFEDFVSWRALLVDKLFHMYKNMLVRRLSQHKIIKNTEVPVIVAPF